MTEKTENLIPVELSRGDEVGAAAAVGRKPFVEPEVTFPVDVLEATTFFQLTDSGVVPPPPAP